MVRKNKPISNGLYQKAWNYMRRNRNFVVGDIIAITEIKYPNLRDILKVFEVAGYVKAISKEKPLTSNRYKLVKYTGVRVPVYNKRKQLLYDPNLDKYIEIKRISSMLKIVNAIDKSPISKEEINKTTMLSHATDVKCYVKLKELEIITRISPIQKNSDGHVLFNIDFKKIEEFKRNEMSKDLLKKACDHHKSQRIVGEMIGKSAATVNLILKGTYPNPQKIFQKVTEVFKHLLTDKIDCPILDEIHVDVCKKYGLWAKQDKVHKDRLYMKVKSHCINCTRSK